MHSSLQFKFITWNFLNFVEDVRKSYNCGQYEDYLDLGLIIKTLEGYELSINLQSAKIVV